MYRNGCKTNKYYIKFVIKCTVQVIITVTNPRPSPPSLGLVVTLPSVVLNMCNRQPEQNTRECSSATHRLKYRWHS